MRSRATPSSTYSARESCSATRVASLSVGLRAFDEAGAVTNEAGAAIDEAGAVSD